MATSYIVIQCNFIDKLLYFTTLLCNIFKKISRPTAKK